MGSKGLISIVLHLLAFNTSVLSVHQLDALLVVSCI